MDNSLLIVTSSPPGERTVGENYIRDFKSLLPFSDVRIATLLKDPDKNAESASSISIRVRFIHAWRKGPGIVRNVGRLLALSTLTRNSAIEAATAIKKYCESYQIGHILFVMENPLIFQIAERLASEPLINRSCLVWDHPVHVIRNFGHEGLSLHRLRRSFERGLLGCRTIIAVSKRLTQELSLQFPKSKCISWKAPVFSSKTSSLSSDAAPSPLTIGFAGSVTAPNEFNILLDALDRVDWQVGGRSVELRLFGSRYVLSARTRRAIRYCGFFPSTLEVQEELSKCDILFLPQPFADSEMLIAEYSFPTKLTTYLGARRPILLFAPRNASIPSEFCTSDSNTWKFGIHCSDAHGTRLPELLAIFATDADLRSKFDGNISASLEAEFSPSQAKEVLTRAFGNSIEA